MRSLTRSRMLPAWSVALVLVVLSTGLAQVSPSTATPATPITMPLLTSHSVSAPPSTTASPSSMISGIRNKISAGDLPSAESVLEVYRTKNGEDGPWLTGLSWLARGALLVGDTAKARHYVIQVRENCAARIAHGADLAKDHDLEIAFGAACEVEAQIIERANGAREAAEYLRTELSHLKGPMTLRARFQKRLNMLTLTGTPAPELTVEDHLGAPPPSLASLRGTPVLIFLWHEGCPDCKAQEEALARAMSKYKERGLQLIALTRYYDDSDRVQEKARIDSVWKAVYAGVGTVPIVISTASVEAYGGSSTPTFIFIDRSGIVRRYTPTRLTELELNRTLEQLLR